MVDLSMDIEASLGISCQSVCKVTYSSLKVRLAIVDQGSKQETTTIAEAFGFYRNTMLHCPNTALV